MQKVRSIFGTLLGRKRTFTFKKQDVEKENQRQAQVWKDVVEPMMKIFETGDYKHDGIPDNPLKDDNSESTSSKDKSDHRRSSFRSSRSSVSLPSNELDLEVTAGSNPTSWTPEEKLQEYLKHNEEIEEVNAKIEVAFYTPQDPQVHTDSKTLEAMHNKLKELSLALVNTQEQVYEALCSRYPLLYKHNVHPSRMVVYHFAKKYRFLYRQGGECASQIRSLLWEVCSLSEVEKTKYKSFEFVPTGAGKDGGAGMKTGPSAYFESLLAESKKHENDTDLQSKQRLILEQIDKDIHRTLADESYFGEHEENNLKLRNVLRAFSIHHPKIGYCQSMNFVAGGLLMIFDDEERTFWVLCRLILEIMPTDYYSLSMSGVVTDVQVLGKLLKQHHPAVDSLLERLEVKLEILCCHMLMSLCFGAAPLPVAQRCMDLVLVEGSFVLVAVVLAMIVVCKGQILAQDDAGDMMLLLASIGRDLEEEVWEEFFACVYFYIEVTGNEIKKMRAELADSVRKAQKKLLAKCFIGVDIPPSDDDEHNDDEDDLDDDDDDDDEAVLTPRHSSSGTSSPKRIRRRRMESADVLLNSPSTPPLANRGIRATSLMLPPSSSSKRRARSSDMSKNRSRDGSKGGSGQRGRSSRSRGLDSRISASRSRSRRRRRERKQRLKQQKQQQRRQQKLPPDLAWMKKVKRIPTTLDWLLRHVTEAKGAEVAQRLSKGTDEKLERSKKKQQMLSVRVPPGVGSGQLIQVKTPYGRLLRVRVPHGYRSGMQFLVEYNDRKIPSSDETKRRKPERKSGGASELEAGEGEGGGRGELRLKFRVPANAKPGQTVFVKTPEGQRLKVILPKSAYPGKQLKVNYTLTSSPAPSNRTNRSVGEDGTLMVSKVRGIAKQMGIQPGDVIESIAGSKVTPYSWKKAYIEAICPFPIVLVTSTQRRHNSSSSSIINHRAVENTGDSSTSRQSLLQRRKVTVWKTPFGMTCNQAYGSAVVVSKVEGEAARCNVCPGDRLEKIAGQRVQQNTWKEIFESACKQLPFEIVLLPAAATANAASATTPPPSSSSSTSTHAPIHRKQQQQQHRLLQSRTSPIGQDGTISLSFDATKPIGIELKESDGRLLVLGTEPGKQAAGRVSNGWQLLSIAGVSVKTQREVGAVMRKHRRQNAPPVQMVFDICLPVSRRTSIAPPKGPPPPSAKWASELETLVDMGLTNTSANIVALEKTNGQINDAISMLLSSADTKRSSSSGGGKRSSADSGSFSSSRPGQGSASSSRRASNENDYRHKMAQLRGMGFDNDRQAAAALASANGDVNAACAMLISEQSAKK
eukprot:jgi/Bigna1/86885/estExt_fgenesh1_pg.C_140213